jgi:thiol-disulfide isomerase/thioredoxin
MKTLKSNRFKLLAFGLLLSSTLVAVVAAQNAKPATAKPAPITATKAQGNFKLAPDFIAGGQWFNSKPLSIKELRGKVTIVNIWVYSCINCHNSLPTLQSWYKKYKDAGLEIVGVHTPEFESDKPAANVLASLKETGVTWPVVQDNDSATWSAYNNRFWPAFYLVDKSGNIRKVHAGELSDRYPAAIPGLEKTIQELIAEKPSAN